MILAPSYDNCDNALLIPVRHSFQLLISQDSKTKETQVACTSLASGNYIVKIHTDYSVQMARIAK